MYHVELREFPRSLNRFNLTGPQIGAILVPWAQRETVEVNGQRWDPREATIKVLEGPEIPIHRLSLGRGWPLAERQGEDVTTRVLEEARRAVADGSAYREAPPSDGLPPAGAGEGAGVDPRAPAPPEGAPGPAADYPSAAGAASAADQLAAGVQLAGLLGADPGRLLTAWRSVSGRTSGLSPSESLALAERELGGG